VGAEVVEDDVNLLAARAPGNDFFEKGDEIQAGVAGCCFAVYAAGGRFQPRRRASALRGGGMRWLLTVQDRSAREEFLLTQRFLGDILGTGRTTINVLARHFERQALIGHNRGKIRILNRKGLEAAACDCYEATRSTLIELYQ
jgi:hypothetical protein